MSDTAAAVDGVYLHFCLAMLMIIALSDGELGLQLSYRCLATIGVMDNAVGWLRLR